MSSSSLSGLPPALTRLATRVRRILAATLHEMVPEQPQEKNSEEEEEEAEVRLRKNRKLRPVTGNERGGLGLITLANVSGVCTG